MPVFSAGLLRSGPAAGPFKAAIAAERPKSRSRRYQNGNIGTFKQSATNEFIGEIVTLSLQAKNVRIVPQPASANENAPTHRVLVGRVEIGARWSKVSTDGRPYVGLKLDDPSFNAPIFANHFDDEDSKGYNLIWSRPTGRNRD